MDGEEISFQSNEDRDLFPKVSFHFSVYFQWKKALGNWGYDMIADARLHRHYHHLYAKIVNYVIDFLVGKYNNLSYTTILFIVLSRERKHSIMEKVNKTLH